MDFEKSEFCERLKQARIKAKMSQAELSGKIDRPQVRISSYETGKTTPDAETLAAICKVTGADANWLLFGDGGAPDKSEITSEITPENWLRYFIQLLTSPQAVCGYVTSIYGEDTKICGNSIVLNNRVGCKDDLNMWERLDEDAATVSFRGKEMATFFRQLAIMETVKESVPPETMQDLEETAIKKGINIFQPDILPF